jgi:hypothetical protein
MLQQQLKQLSSEENEFFNPISYLQQEIREEDAFGYQYHLEASL